ncbi:MAG TPA: TIM barrel protein [Micromonosporaceae bacterium]
MRIAGAPISWGVCEIPGWGVQLPPSRVLAEMAELGLVATEFGPEGFLPAEPAAKAAVLAAAGLAAVGGFVPVVLHEPGHDPLSEVDAVLDGFVAAGADTLVLAAATGSDDYDSRPELDDAGWKRLLANLDRLAELARSRGITPTLHPHVGTMVERGDEVHRVLDGSDTPLCLDTGHLLIGGTDPALLAAQAANRIAHVHLKDVDADRAARVRSGEIGYRAAVADGMYRPLGAGDVDIAGIIATLSAAGYAGWYVLEQDLVLTTEPSGSTGPRDNVAASLAYLAGLPRHRLPS